MTDLTLVDCLKRQVRERGNALAMRAGEKTWTFADLDNQSNQIAGALAAMGIGKGDRVACLTKHHPQCLLLCLAACKLGAVCMPVNWRLAGPEIQQIMNHGEAKFLMVDE
ncbi:MAG: AMP-binding protein, partial [Alphaproteobacteria bacterium]